VDDEISICLLLENFLSQDYDVVTLNNKFDAVEWLEGNLPDLILNVIQMSEMNGYEFSENVRKRGFTKHTPILMLSARSESEELIKSYKMGRHKIT
jgi:DNA-binding response OmpR family regulator